MVEPLLFPEQISGVGCFVLLRHHRAAVISRGEGTLHQKARRWGQAGCRDLLSLLQVEQIHSYTELQTLCKNGARHIRAVTIVKIFNSCVICFYC